MDRISAGPRWTGWVYGRLPGLCIELIQRCVWSPELGFTRWRALGSVHTWRSYTPRLLGHGSPFIWICCCAAWIADKWCIHLFENAATGKLYGLFHHALSLQFLHLRSRCGLRCMGCHSKWMEAPCVLQEQRDSHTGAGIGAITVMHSPHKCELSPKEQGVPCVRNDWRADMSLTFIEMLC